VNNLDFSQKSNKNQNPVFLFVKLFFHCHWRCGEIS
jgi:hypothetical protein